MSDQQLVQSALTWLLANATSIGAVFGWVTKPLRERIERLEKQVESLSEQLRDAEVAGGKDSEEHASFRRELDDIRQTLRELQQDLNHSVSDEEFKGYVSVAGTKFESVLTKLGWIAGKLGVGPSG